MKTKGFSWFLIFIVIANFILFVFQVIETAIFWGIMVVGALLAYKILPKLNKKQYLNKK